MLQIEKTSIGYLLIENGRAVRILKDHEAWVMAIALKTHPAQA